MAATVPASAAPAGAPASVPADAHLPPMPDVSEAIEPSSAQVQGAPPLQQVTFREAVERAMAYNVAATLAKEDVALAQASTAAATAATSPNFYVQATYTRLDHARELAGRVLNGRDQVNAYVGVNQPVLVPRIWGNRREAKDQEHVAWAGHRNARRTAAIGAANAYLDVVVARRNVEVGRSASATDRAHLAIAQARFAAGISNRLDALRAEDELAQSEAQLAGSLAQLAQSQERLGVWVGSAQPLDVADDAALLAPTVRACTTGGTPTLARRADVALSHRELHQAQRIRRHSWLDFMPSILATGQLFVQDPPTTQYPRHGWQVQVLVSLPLWDGGARQALVRQRIAGERQAIYRLDALERQARSEVRAALAVLREAERQIVEASRSAAAAQAAVILTVRAYRGGTLGNLEVVDAERRNRDAQIRKAQAEDTLRRARLDLVVATGKFPELTGEVVE